MSEDRRVTSDGKHVYLDGRRIATADNETTAAGIAAALEYVGLGFMEIPPTASKAIIEALV